ncbi:unnamed protein product [Rotaria sp. Silwood1]|nr:unnamed protein product [Rotaria sp. Silwood1]CAF1692373.1 unnamed protein product [Rotaria sp. Silwood1]CAF3737748.1 unnamed protein product [Rotaria sp. Silwood1]CAF3862840.1 unnamed protein product [Rotaria sp. Silwood1]CAF4851207.1 unnamed protein product [Rotaria sp. Silwood1]
MDFSHLAFDFQWEQCFSIIDKWKTTMIEHIINIHQEKSTEIQIYKEQAEKNFFYEKKNFILNMNEYFQHSYILSYEINLFKNKLNQLKKNIIHRPLPLHIDIDTCLLNKTIRIYQIFDKQLYNQRKINAEYKIPTQTIYLISTSNNQIIIVNYELKIFLYDKLIGFIDEINMLDYTNEYLNDICWSITYKNFLFLCDYSLWSLDNLLLKKLAHISNKKHFLNNLTCFHNYVFFIYDQGEFIDRWLIQPQWKLDKRWLRTHNNDNILSITSNIDYLLIYTNKSIQLCSEDFIIQYLIDLTNQEHLYSNFTFLSTYQIWLIIDKQTQLLKYFHIHNQTIQTLDQIYVKIISSMGDNELALVTNDDYHLQILSI